MRITKRRWIIIALALIGAGLITAFAAMAALGFDFTRLNDETAESNSYLIDEQFGNISIKGDISDINIVKSYDGVCRIDVESSSRYKFTYSVEGKALNIEHTDDRRWYEYIGVFDFGEDFSVTLCLPEYAYSNLHIETSTGDVTTDPELCFDSASIEATTADISFSSSVKGAFECETSTGDINIQNTSVGSLDLKASAGHINLSSVRCEGVSRVSAETGDCVISSFTSKEMYLNVDTSYMEFNDMLIEGLLKLTSDTGNIMFNSCDAGTINIETSTGDVEGILLSSKIFYTDTSTGKVNVPHTTEGGVCEIRTSTGDIVLSIKNS